MPPLRFAVIGCGGHSTAFQLPALNRSARVSLTALVDADGAWVRTLAKRFRVREAYTGVDDLPGRVDAALIATPNTTHADIACSLLRHGIHVLCEKPVATTREDVERMLDASARSGARLMAAHCLRFSSNLTAMKDAIARGWLGDLISITGAIGTPYHHGAHRTDFRKQRRLSGGGVLVDLGIHLIDLALWFTAASPLSVTYEAERADGWDLETDACVRIEFPGGTHARVECSFTRALANAVTVRGTRGWARASLYDPTELTLFSDSARVCAKDGAQRLMLPAGSMYDAQIDHFCECVASGDEFLVTPGQVRSGISVVDNCYSGGLACV